MPIKNKTIEKSFPFKTTLDLSLLIKYWKNNLSSQNGNGVYPTQEILTKIDAAKSLHQPITDVKELTKHKELLGFLMSAIFPPAVIDTKIMAALESFSMNAFYATPGFQRVVPVDKNLKPTTNILGDAAPLPRIYREVI